MRAPAAHQKLGVIRYSRQRPVVRAAIDQTGELRKVTLQPGGKGVDVVFLRRSEGFASELGDDGPVMANG